MEVDAEAEALAVEGDRGIDVIDDVPHVDRGHVLYLPPRSSVMLTISVADTFTS
jgi:hypothetical protein